MKKSKTMYAIRNKDTEKFWMSTMGGHVWTNSPCVSQLDEDEIKAEQKCCNIQLNCPEYRGKIEVSEVIMSWNNTDKMKHYESRKIASETTYCVCESNSDGGKILATRVEEDDAILIVQALNRHKPTESN